MKFDTAFERSHAPNTMNAEKDKAPERPQRVWITWDDAYPWPTPEMGGDEYVHIDLLATARKEAREAAFKDAIAAVPQVGVTFTEGYEEWIDAPAYRESVIEALERAATTDKENSDETD